MSKNEPILPSHVIEQPEPACDRCGQTGATKFGDEFICDECYVACGSCCAGDEE